MVSPVASQQEGTGFDSKSEQSVWNLHVLPVAAWFLSRYSGFLPQSQKHAKLELGHSKLPIGVNLTMDYCLSLYVAPVIYTNTPVQGDPVFALRS